MRASQNGILALFSATLWLCAHSRGDVIGLAAFIDDIYAPNPYGFATRVNLVAVCDSPDDNVVAVSNARISLSGIFSPYGWYNASPNPGVDPVAGAAPLTGIDWKAQPWMLGDSYVTIGLGQGASINTTVLDRSFDDALFLSSGSIGDGAGWYNSDPTNGQGLPWTFSPTFGIGYVFLGTFSILLDEYDHLQPPKLHVTTMSITSVSGAFGTELSTWELTEPISFDYLPPAPSTALALAMFGLIARRRRA